MDTLLKTEKYRSLNYFYACTNIAVISIQMIFMIVRIRRHLSMLFYKHTMATEEKRLNWLKLRTVEIECRLINYPAATTLELNPKRLTGFVKQKLINIQKNSRVYTSVVIPDYSKQCILEIERKELEDSAKLIKANPPLFRCLVGNEYTKDVDYQQKLKEIDYKIDLELVKPQEGTRTAFMSLESLESIAKLKGELE